MIELATLWTALKALLDVFTLLAMVWCMHISITTNDRMEGVHTALWAIILLLFIKF